MKKLSIIIALLLVFTLSAIPALAVDLEYDKTPDEAVTEVDNGTLYYGFTNMDGDDEPFLCTGALAYSPTAVGYLDYHVSFKLYWDASNLDEGGTAEDGTGYLDNVLSMFTLSELPSDVIDINDEDFRDAALQYRFMNRHIQQVPWGKGGCDLADYGGDTVSTNTLFSHGGVGELHIEVSTDEDGTMIRAYCNDQGTERALCWTIRDNGSFAADKPQYLCFSLLGNPLFTAYDFEIVSSDIDGLTGTHITDWQYLAADECDPFQTTGVIELAEKEETTVPETDPPATDAPTTDAPTTEAPTTDAPTTDATTNAPETTAPENNDSNNTTTIIIIVVVAVVVIAAVVIIVAAKKKKQ